MIYPRSHDGKPEAPVRSRLLENGNGLTMHVLEAGFETENRPCVLLLHGFPETAYSWRKVLPLLAAAGFHAVAPDQRGYGRTTGWDDRHDGDLASFHMLNLVQDTLGLVHALQLNSVAAVIGHDFGSPVAAWCALLHPEVFRSAALLSAPFGGPPRPVPGARSAMSAVAESLAALHPPRKHYQAYFSTRAADAEMRECPQGIHAFLRAYFYIKSADWQPNMPHPLKSWAADELAKMPRYYIMDMAKNMAETVAEHAPSEAEAARCAWLRDDELRVYSEEFARTSFRGGLKWYRNAIDAEGAVKLQAYAGRRIDVPCCFIAGKSDWGTYQSPGALQAMESSACSQFRGAHLIEGAGHWVQQEQPAAVSELLINFVARETEEPA
ncbi:MAG TPA: alpha/beta hydrolase [Steroidobacteraceae bacterium]|nr:alpha/beta hydrolase [Steroidobacteraceae bacterium]